jgi:secreted trypsin-like serine protease
MTRGLRSTLLVLAAAALVAGPAAGARDDDRIVGGVPASLGEYPAQGFLGIDSNGDTTFDQACGGTLLSGIWFLTAAHCVTDGTGGVLPPTAFFVYLGDHDLTAPNPAENFYDIVNVERHAGYDDATHQNDLAMLRLERIAPQQPLRVIRVDESAKWAPGTTARIIGWGTTSEGGPASNQLLEATVPIRADNDCGSYGLDFDPSTMLCAAPQAGGTDTCQGDSGGPLMAPDGAGLVLVGVTSWGIGCARPEFPGIYVRIGAPALNQWVMERHSRVSFTVTGVLNSGQPIGFNGSAFFPGGGGFLTWDLDGDGQFDDAGGPSASWIYPTGGTYSVGVKGANGVDEAFTRQTIVVNSTPSARASNGSVYPVGEGRTVRLVGSGADPEGQPLTYAWDYDGDNAFETSGAAPLFSAIRLDGPASRTVAFRVCDTAGACATDTAIVRVVNVRPVVRAGRDRRVRRARRLRFRVTARDIAADRLRYRWTCGNRARGSGRTVTCGYRRAGRYVIRITVTDGDGGVGRDSVRVRVRR